MPLRSLALAAALAAPLQAGTLRGRLTGASDPQELVVSLEEGPALSPVEPAADRAMNQLGKKFSPKVAAVRAGTPLRFENLDDVFHNVFSLDKRQPFDLGLYKGSRRFADDRKTPSPAASEPMVAFSSAGAYPVFCNIHPDMTGTVYAFDHGYFARADKDGLFELPAPDSGTVTLLIQGPSLPKPLRRRVSLPAEARVELAVKAKRFALKAPHTRKDGSEYGGAYGGKP